MVCTGNIGRSPMMERLGRHQLRALGVDSGWSVTSAGTWATSGHPMEPFAEQVLAERGVDVSDFRATLLTAELLTSADLVLTATRDHRSQAVNMVPGAVRRTFTLLELERIVRAAGPAPDPAAVATGASPTDRSRAAVVWATQMRGAVPRPDAAADDDVPDPLGESVEFYRARADSVQRALEQVVPFLLGLRAAPPAG
jgi:protein-tyrosine phosphatase